MDAQVRSLIFKHYNLARHSKTFETGRLNRALGLALRDEPRKYGQTHTHCTCPDREQRGGFCKHIIQMIIMRRVSEDLMQIWEGTYTYVSYKHRRKIDHNNRTSLRRDPARVPHAISR